MNVFNKILKFFPKAVVSPFTASRKKSIINPELNNHTALGGNTWRLIYRYQDASLPPKFHRSYTINITSRKIHISIDSYGQVLSKKSLSITKRKYESFIATLLALNIKGREEIKSTGCVGGTSDELDIDISGDYKVKGYMYHCGSETFGNLEGDVTKAVELFKALIPGLQNRLNDSKK